jgi:hypothetical protein
MKKPGGQPGFSDTASASVYVFFGSNLSEASFMQ